jgi:RNA polymerase sigma-70 factor (ECF subfamily)
LAFCGVLSVDGYERTSKCEDCVVSEPLLSRAAQGDEDAFRELTDPHRRELHVHCYRILGSMHDAEDALQETMLAAWRGLQGFEQRASLRGWLYRIATNRCLDALRDSARRPPAPIDPPFVAPEPTRVAEPTWLEPYPDAWLEGMVDTAPGPDALYEAREAIELAFIAALQQLPPRQRATLVLRDVLGFRTAEVAALVDSTEESVKGALKRARATLAQHRPSAEREGAPLPDSPQERELVRRFVEVWEADDIDGVVALLTENAWVTMPPATLQYQGPAAIADFLQQAAAWRADRRHILVPTRANTQPAFGTYRTDQHAPIAHATGLMVLTLEGSQIAAITQFLDASILSSFGLPRTLRD